MSLNYFDRHTHRIEVDRSDLRCFVACLVAWVVCLAVMSAC